MQSKTSYFNRTIFLSQLKRFWPLYAAYFVIWVFILPVPLSSSLIGIRVYGGDFVMRTANQLMVTGLYGGAVMSAIFGGLFAMAAFHYLYNNRSVSQMCSLPVSREGAFLSSFLPGLAVMLVSNLVIILITLIQTASFGAAVAGYAFQALAMMCLTSLFFYGFAAFCASLTGHILVMPLVYALLNFVVVAVVMLSYAMLEKIVYGLSIQGVEESFLMMFSPIVCIVAMTRIGSILDTSVSNGQAGGEIIGYSYGHWPYLIVIAIIGLVFAALAMLLIKRRRMEAAGDVVAQKPLKPVFKYCLTLGCALVAGVGLFFLVFEYSYYSVGFSGTMLILAFMLLGAFIGYFAAEMLINKSLRVFSAKKWKGFGVAALIIAALIISFDLDLFGYERRVPDPAQVESIATYGYGAPLTIKDPGDIQTMVGIHESLIENKKLHETSGYGNYSPSLYLEYEMKDGSFISRRYYINTYVTEDDYAIIDFFNTPANIIARNDPGVEVNAKTIDLAYINEYASDSEGFRGLNLTTEEALELYYDCILPDMKDGTIGLVSYGWYYYNAGYDNIFLLGDINYQLSERKLAEEHYYGSMSFTPTIYSARTNAWLTEHGVRLMAYDTETGEAVPFE